MFTRRSKRIACLAFVILYTARLSSAAVFTWDGGDGSTNDMVAGINWVGDVAPSIQTNPATDELHFGPATFTTVQAPGQMFIDQLIFDPGAPVYSFPITLAGGGSDIAFLGGPNSLIVNNSSNNQPIVAQLNLSGATVKTPGAGLTIGGDPSSYIYATSAAARFWLTHDVTVNAQQFQSGARHVYGANGPATTNTDPAGTLILDAASGTGSTSGTNFTGQVNVWSGAVRVGNNDALGRSSSTGNNTFVHGTFVASTSVLAPLLGGYEHGIGRLELYNNVTVTERVRIDSRIDDAKDFDHVVNFSGDNVLGDANANTGINAMGGAGHFNFNSISGKLTLGSTTNLHVSDGPRSDSTSGVNSVWTFRGAGNIELQGKLGQESGMAGSMAGLEGTVASALRKQGAGTLTFSGVGNDWDGGTLIEGGTVDVTATGDFSMVGNRVHVAAGATLDLSAVGGVSMVAGKTLSGAGTFKGNVTTNDPTAVISPGGIGGLDGSDAISVAAGAGSLTLQNDLNMSGSGAMEWSLAALSTTGPGTNFDQTVVGGTLTLGAGTTLALDFSLLLGQGPGSGNPFWNTAHSWKIIDTVGNNATSTFASVTGAAGFSTSIVGGDIMLNFGAAHAGDFDSDGDVDGADFVAWQTNFPKATGATLAQGDADGDGDVDGADFVVWQTNFPFTPGPGSSPVPEPQGLVLVGIGGLFALRNLRKRV
jgi:autotransporter-associated beta strand protein